MKTHTIEEIQVKIDELEAIRQALEESIRKLEQYRACIKYSDLHYNKMYGSDLIRAGKNAMKAKWL